MKNLLLLFILFYLSPVFGQQYLSFWYNSENGLPQNSVKDITKDKYGFIWIATEGGIVRYDGYSFLTYKNHKLSNLNFAYFKGNTSEDRILNNNNEEQQYILIKNRKIIVQDPKLISKKFTFNSYFNNKRYLNVTKKGFTFYMDRAYFVNTQDGVYLFEDDKIIYKKDKERKDKIVLQSAKIKDLKHFFILKETLFIKLPNEKNFVAIKDGKISQVVTDSLYNDPDSRIFWQKVSDQVFIFNRGKIYRSEYIDGKLKLHFIIHLKNSEIDFGTLSSIFYDKDYNNLYLGTVSQGLCLVKISSFHTPRTETSLENRIYYTTLPFSINSVINTQGRVFDDKTLVKDFHFSSKKDFYTIADDDSGNILIPADKYLKRILKNAGYQKADSINLNTSIQTILKDKRMYALQLGYSSPYILNIYNNDRFEKPEYVLTSTSAINAVRVIDHDRLMIGRDNGLFILSKSEKTLQQLSDLNIKNIVPGNDGNYWIISRGKGFYLFKNNKLTKMPYDENGYISSTHNVLEDKKGVLWIPTNNGLFKVLKAKLLEYVNNKNTDVFYYRYSKKAGFNTNEFNGTGSKYNATTLPNGNFVLPSMDGYVFFDPLKVPTYYPKAENIYVERAKAKSPDFFYFKDNLTLENNFEQASVFIDIPYYSNNDNLYIETSLQQDNDPEKWRRLKDREYTLSKLSPGDYTLNIRILISPDGKFAYKKVFITIPPLFYQTLWFRILASVAFLGLILFIILLRTKILTTQNNELKKIVHQKNDELRNTQDQLKNESEYQQNLIQTINHDITTPIKYLSAMSQKLSETDNPKLQKQYFNTIYKSSEELYKFTLNLKNYTELFSNESKAFQEHSYPIFDLLETKKKLFEEIASQKNTKIINNSSKSIKLNFNESIMSAVIHNLLDNAVKNTFGGEILMGAKTEENATIISISDSGTGMGDELSEYYNNLVNNIENKPSSFRNQGLGLHLVVQLLKKIGGKIIFKKNTPKGTIAQIRIQNQS